MEKILNEILKKVNSIDSKVDNLEIKIDKLEIEIKSTKEQTAILTEFKTFSTEKLNKISDDVDFIKHEGVETKQDLFNIKRNLKSIK